VLALVLARTPWARSRVVIHQSSRTLARRLSRVIDGVAAPVCFGTGGLCPAWAAAGDEFRVRRTLRQQFDFVRFELSPFTGFQPSQFQSADLYAAQFADCMTEHRPHAADLPFFAFGHDNFQNGLIAAFGDLDITRRGHPLFIAQPHAALPFFECFGGRQTIHDHAIGLGMTKTGVG
jgi:hypothetical protein